AWEKTPKVRLTGGQMPNGGFSFKSVINPLPTVDDWALLPDGTVAIVRGHDYHIDWISPEGNVTSAPKMPFDWKRMSDSDKVAFLDSTQKAMAAQMARGGGAGRGAPGGMQI